MIEKDKISKLKEAVFNKRPVLRELLGQHSQVFLKDYVSKLFEFSSAEENARKKECISAISAEAGRFFGISEVASIVSQLESSYTVSTAEHHGPLTHPFFVHSNLLASVGKNENIIMLAVGNVSLSNSSYPRGVTFHNHLGNLIRVPFFPASNRLFPVYKHRAYNEAELMVLVEKVKKSFHGHFFSGIENPSLDELFQNIYGHKDILNTKLYSEQISKSNNLLWQMISPNKVSFPRLVNLQLEDVVLNLITSHHLFSDTEISDILLNPETWRLIEQYMDGIPGAFSLKEKSGTFLFWALPQGCNKRQQLWRKGGSLVSEEGYKVTLEPMELYRAIEKKELVPSNFLNLLILSEYYGVRCLGGFSQGTYLTLIHEAYCKVRRKNSANINVQTKAFLSDIVAVYGQFAGYKIFPVTSLDLILYGKSDLWSKFLNTTETLSLEEAVMPLFPEFYKILYPAVERDAVLEQIQISDIINYYNLNEKINPCITIPK